MFKDLIKQFNLWVSIFCFILSFFNLFIFERKYLLLTILILIIGVVDMFNAVMTVRVNKKDK
mgnify:FL=1